MAPTGTIQDVKHVVILMQENRSFDHYFGTLKGVRGFGDRNVLVTENGTNVFYQRKGLRMVAPFPALTQCVDDVDHSESSGEEARNSGWWDRWLDAKSLGAMSYYTRADMPFYYGLADAYTICDSYYCSVMGPTFPNRLYLFTGMVDPKGTGGGPVYENDVPTNGYTWTTYPERLEKAGVSWRVYRPPGDWFGDALAWFKQFRAAERGTPLYDRGMAIVPDVVEAFRHDVTNGTLPAVSWIIPTGTASEHPSFSPADGEVFAQALLAALSANAEVYASTVFYHHVRREWRVLRSCSRTDRAAGDGG